MRALRPSNLAAVDLCKKSVHKEIVKLFTRDLGYNARNEIICGIGINSLLTWSINKLAVEAKEKEIIGGIFGDILGVNIKESLANLDEESFNQAVDTICRAKSIFIIGIRSSSMLADFLNHYLCYMFGNVKLLFSNSTNELFEQIFRITKDDVLIAISFPRYSSRTKLAAEFAKKKGASVIAITDSDSSPIASYADSKLYAKSDMASFVDSLVAPLSIINALIAAIGRKKKDTIKETFDDLEKIWEEYDVYEIGRQ